MNIQQEINASDISERILRGETLEQIADSLNTTIYQVRAVLSLENIRVRDLKQTLSQRINEQINRWKMENVRLKDAAKELDVSTAHLSNTLRALGLTIDGKQVTNPSKIRYQTDKVLEILMTKGGSVRSICDELGFLKNVNAIKIEIDRRGIDAQDYYYAFRQYHNWLVQPGKVEVTGLADRTLPAKCLKCGTIHRVNYSNIVSGQSRSCLSCRVPEPRSVVDTNTGEIFSSIRSALIAIDCLDSYQKALYHLKTKGSYDIGGHTLKLTEEDT